MHLQPLCEYPHITRLFRPWYLQLPADEHAAYVSLIRRCWAQETSERPTFAEAILELRGVMSRLIGAAMPGSPVTPAAARD